jgi:hypothetical protein
MSPQPHPAVLAAHRAADVVLSHVHDATTGSFWHRWFEKPDERHFADDVRSFIVTLRNLLDVPPQMLTREDLISIGQETDRVVQKVEAAIEGSGAAGSNVASSLAPAVYVIRARYEDLYKRGAGK